MGYSFKCYGHENIIAKHKTTFEFTKDEELSLNGDCIIGVRSNFSLPSLKSFIKSLGSNKKITITIETLDYNKSGYNNKKSNGEIMKKQKNDEKFIEKINCEINPDFNSDREMVIRKGDFISERTFAIRADKGACEVNARVVNFLKDGNAVIVVCLEKNS